MKRKIELLAPAGNETALHAAVQSGADAVYIGGPKFGARQSAENFDESGIKKAADYCHLYGVDLHAAVNTLIKEKELKALADYVYMLNDSGVDALIVQDIGAAKLIHSIIPDMPLHASTQMTVTSLDGVKYLEDVGFSRVVLARELSAREIEHICAHAKAEIEIFVHGAICMCYSGQCLMSSILGGRSGNRGRCAQPCRLPYKITERGKILSEGYMLSPKDMALINELSYIESIGVASLKIEGRLKRAEYVSAVVGIYRKYLDNPHKVSPADMKELTDAFSRSGFTDGYFTENLGKNMMSHENPGNASKNEFTDAAKHRAAPDANIRKIPVSIEASLVENAPLSVIISDNDGNIAAESGTVYAQQAINRPLDEARLREQLSKLGQTPFAAENIFCSVGSGITVPIKEINEVRRKAAEQLIALRQSRSIGRKCDANITFSAKDNPSAALGLTADVMTLQQAFTAIQHGIKTIYAPNSVVSDIQSADSELKIIAKLPDIFDGETPVSDYIEVSSPAAIRHYRGKKLYGGFRLNIFNSVTANHYSELEAVTLSPELNTAEIRKLTENTDVNAEIIGYGRLPLMLMRNCPLKAADKCQDGKPRYALHDRKGEEFPVICQKNCRAVLLNSKPVFIADKLNDFTPLGISTIRLMFTLETPGECGRIIDEYKNALSGKAVSSPPENTFTRGHFYRGVM